MVSSSSFDTFSKKKLGLGLGNSKAEHKNKNQFSINESIWVLVEVTKFDLYEKLTVTFQFMYEILNFNDRPQISSPLKERGSTTNAGLKRNRESVDKA